MKQKDVSADALREIVALAKRQVALENLVTDTENSLKAQKELLAEVSEVDLPAAMKEVQLQKFTLDTGEEIVIKEDFRVGIPVDRKAEAFDWLNGKGFGGLIKTLVVVAFGKGELERAQALTVALAKKKLEVSLERDVHWQTLKAFINEQTKADKPIAIPLELFGATPANKAIIKPPKIRKE